MEVVCVPPPAQGTVRKTRQGRRDAETFGLTPGTRICLQRPSPGGPILDAASAGGEHISLASAAHVLGPNQRWLSSSTCGPQLPPA